ncbi:PspC domain-containing protein [Streptomyces fuscichromogenes]|uniref:Membrane protein n=1 Tax=Streptomyces fuscichromogenes TaxID=1324013 RepID=A0A917XH83_9ACTN|nr:PspC domain-containing protein [Streptomyces fuscichromogenes]GGN24233.1 membrane protein [Streptomyces fuscichromogenes]
MTDHEHAATGPGPGSGPRPAAGTGPSDAAPAATGTSAAGADAGAEAVDAASPRFRRDRRHKVIAGVCAGLGRHTDLDPVIFRITLAVLAATGGIGLLFYGFAWLFVPYEDDEENEVRKLLTGRVDGQALAAVLFALVGCGVLLTMLRNGQVLAFAVVLSVLLAGAGYWSRRRGAPDPDPLSAQAVADAPPEAQAPPIPISYPSWWRDPIVKDGTHVGGTGYLWGPADVRGRNTPGLDVRLSTPWVHGQNAGARQSAPPKPRGPHWIGGWIFLLALVAGALGTGLTWNTHPLGTSLQSGLAAALIVFGVGTAVSSFLGRTGAGSLFLALVTAALLAGASALPSDIGTHWTRASWTPATAAEVPAAYKLGTGVATLDLTHIRIAKGQTVSTSAEVAAGQLKIVVPADTTVRMSIDVGLGDIRLPGEDKKDVDVEPGKRRDVTLPPTSGAKNAGMLSLVLQVGAGQVEVTRAAA